MANSFGDQLLKAGLVNKNQLHKAKKNKHRQKKAQQAADPAALAASDAARRAAAEKAARDRELNQQHKAKQARRALQAQVHQLVTLNRIEREDGDIGYNFQDGSAIRKLFVTPEIHQRLTDGRLAIARLDGDYALIPAAVADKIRQRDADCIVSQSAAEAATPEEDDPYAQYRVPDDLMW